MTSLFKKKKKIWQRRRTAYKSRSSFFPKKRNSVKFLKKITVAGFIFLIIYFILFSQFFLIKEIKIEGNKNILSSDIKEVINKNISQPVLKFIPGNNFFLNKDEDVETLLLNEFSEIKSVKLNKKFPDLLEIKITEKNPLIIWCRLDNCYYIDDNGIAFLSAEKKLLAENNKKFIKVIEQLEIKEELEDKSEMSETENNNVESEKKNDITYELNAEQFEKVRLFFTREKQVDWEATYPAFFAIAGEDFGLPVLPELSHRHKSHSLSFAKKIIDDLKRIEVRNNEKMFYIRIDFNFEHNNILVNVIEEKEEGIEEKIILQPIKINDNVSDSDFVNFIVSVNRKIKNTTTLNINYYKTKGTKCRELIAYTDKNTRIYFNAIDNADLQVNYLQDFLSKGMDKKKIDALKYIYLKSGNRIFYK